MSLPVTPSALSDVGRTEPRQLQLLKSVSPRRAEPTQAAQGSGACKCREAVAAGSGAGEAMGVTRGRFARTRIHVIPRRLLFIAASCIAALSFLYTQAVSSYQHRNELPAAAFSDFNCAALGASATRTFKPPGLTPNSSHDNTRAIQSAINQAASLGGGTVALPAGKLIVDGHLVVRSNVKLTGAGKSTILQAGPNFLDSTGPYEGYPLITTVGSSNVTIANLTADQSGNQLESVAHQKERLSAYLIDIRNSKDVIVEGVYTRNPFTYSIAVVDSSDFCVTRCNTQASSSGLYNQLDGIHVLDSYSGQVIDNYVDQRIGKDGDDGLVAHSIDGPVYDVLYAENTVRGGDGGDGMQIAVGRYPIFDIVIRNNTFWGSPFGIRTGYWGSDVNGVVDNVLITNNNIDHLVPGKAFPEGGDAIDIGGFGSIAPVNHIAVTNNFICKAGTILVVHGYADTITNNHFC